LPPGSLSFSFSFPFLFSLILGSINKSTVSDLDLSLDLMLVFYLFMRFSTPKPFLGLPLKCFLLFPIPPPYSLFPSISSMFSYTSSSAWKRGTLWMLEPINGEGLCFVPFNSIMWRKENDNSGIYFGYVVQIVVEDFFTLLQEAWSIQICSSKSWLWALVGKNSRLVEPYWRSSIMKNKSPSSSWVAWRFLCSFPSQCDKATCRPSGWLLWIAGR
ncbi:hypothetical protein Tsubulata_042701, partial [Turnera subulata]